MGVMTALQMSDIIHPHIEVFIAATKRKEIIMKRLLMILFMAGILFGCATVRQPTPIKVESIDIEESPIIWKGMATIESELGIARFVKGTSSYHSKIFTRYDWDSYGWKIYTRGSYLHRFKRANNEVQYSINYRYDRSESKFHPTKYADICKITFDKPPTINELAELIPEIEVFNDPNISVFIRTGRYFSKISLIYFANPSESVTAHHKKLWEADGFGFLYKGGYGFGIEITLEKKEVSPNELSKVESVEMYVVGVRRLTESFKPTHFIRLSK